MWEEWADTTDKKINFRNRGQEQQSKSIKKSIKSQLLSMNLSNPFWNQLMSVEASSRRSPSNHFTNRTSPLQIDHWLTSASSQYSSCWEICLNSTLSLCLPFWFFKHIFPLPYPPQTQKTFKYLPHKAAAASPSSLYHSDPGESTKPKEKYCKIFYFGKLEKYCRISTENVCWSTDWYFSIEARYQNG